ncbi:MAG: hypothetical protein FJX76_18300 [Armatimonadetes bacterium]|nr:hypothetical protein [Armatimonadota bacterium]
MLAARGRAKFIMRAGLDSKKRLSLTRVLTELKSMVGDDLDKLVFRVEINEIGQVLLTPEVSIPAHELWLYKNREASDSVHRGLKEAEEGKFVSKGSFAQFADAEIE